MGELNNTTNELDQLLYQIQHLTLPQMLELVKKSDNTTNRRFRATGPKGSMEGVILDVYLGIIKFDADDGFILARELFFNTDITWELI